MHGGIFYYAVRKYIYHSRVGDDLTAIVRRAVRGVLAGVRASFAPEEIKGARE